MDELTALIIAQNEEEDLPRCLDSLKPLECRILVIDGGSSDQTRAVADQSGAQVLLRPFDDFTSQRSFALSQVETPWVLQIDCDERLSPELAAEIKSLIEKDSADAALLPFQIEFMNQRMRFSGLGGEKHLRLFKKEKIRVLQDRSVHEGYAVADSSRLVTLRGKVLHRPYKNLGEYMVKCELYTDLAAKDFVQRGRTLSLRHRFIPAWEFFSRYILRLGILDGVPGLTWALLSAYHKKVRYFKVRQLLNAR
jgi:glycosyltransferase involved in cell wall biosynthesis